MVGDEADREKALHNRCTMCKHIANNKTCKMGTQDSHTCAWAHNSTEMNDARAEYITFMEPINARINAQWEAEQKAYDESVPTTTAWGPDMPPNAIGAGPGKSNTPIANPLTQSQQTHSGAADHLVHEEMMFQAKLQEAFDKSIKAAVETKVKEKVLNGGPLEDKEALEFREKATAQFAPLLTKIANFSCYWTFTHDKNAPWLEGNEAYEVYLVGPYSQQTFLESEQQSKAANMSLCIQEQVESRIASMPKQLPIEEVQGLKITFREHALQKMVVVYCDDLATKAITTYCEEVFTPTDEAADDENLSKDMEVWNESTKWQWRCAKCEHVNDHHGEISDTTFCSNCKELYESEPAQQAQLTQEQRAHNESDDSVFGIYKPIDQARGLKRVEGSTVTMINVAGMMVAGLEMQLTPDNKNDIVDYRVWMMIKHIGLEGDSSIEQLYEDMCAPVRVEVSMELEELAKQAARTAEIEAKRLADEENRQRDYLATIAQEQLDRAHAQELLDTQLDSEAQNAKTRQDAAQRAKERIAARDAKKPRC